MALSDLCTQKAAQAWCKSGTEKLEMDPALCKAFAEILEEIWSQPWLGNATTRQLIDELSARIEVDQGMDYRPVDDPYNLLDDDDLQVHAALKGEVEFLEEIEEDVEEEDRVYEDPIKEG